MIICVFLRAACSIPDPSTGTVLVTGGITSGYQTLDAVSRYGLQGWLEELPPLNKGRYGHGCGSYVSDGDMVSKVGISNHKSYKGPPD